MTGCRKSLGLGLAAVAFLSTLTTPFGPGGPAIAALLSNGNAAIGPSGEALDDAPLPRALRQLEQRRRLDRDIAERALQAVPGYPQARARRAPPIPLGEELANCLSTLDPQCLLREALAHAYAVGDESRRDWALTDVAGAFAALGRQEHALRSIALIDDPRRALRSLVAAGLTSSPAAPRETLVSGLLPENTEADTGLRHAEAGDWDAAFEQVRGIEKPRFRSVAWSRVARIATRAGRQDRALQALAHAEADIRAIQVVYGKGFAQYEAGLTRQAILEHGADSTNPKAQRAAAAAASAIDLPHLRADMFMRLSSVLSPRLAAEARRLADAALLETKSKLRQVYVLTGPARTSDSIRRAANIAATIEEPHDRARAFVRLANLGDSP